MRTELFNQILGWVVVARQVRGGSLIGEDFITEKEAKALCVCLESDRRINQPHFDLWWVGQKIFLQGLPEGQS